MFLFKPRPAAARQFAPAPAATPALHPARSIPAAGCSAAANPWRGPVRPAVFFDLRQRFVKHIRIQRQRIEFSVRRHFVLRHALQLRFEVIVIARRLDPAFAQHFLQQQHRAHFADQAVKQADLGFVLVEFCFPKFLVQPFQQTRQIAVAQRVTERKRPRRFVARCRLPRRPRNRFFSGRQRTGTAFQFRFPTAARSARRG